MEWASLLRQSPPPGGVSRAAHVVVADAPVESTRCGSVRRKIQLSGGGRGPAAHGPAAAAGAGAGALVWDGFVFFRCVLHRYVLASIQV